MSTFFTPLIFENAPRTALVQPAPQVIPESATLYTFGAALAFLSLAKTAEGAKVRAINAKLKMSFFTIILLELENKTIQHFVL